MRGFTLLEAVVVVAIIAMLSATLLSLNSSSRKQITLFRDRAVIIGAITRAKALAIEKFDDTDACAYGVHFSAYSREIIIFKDVLKLGESSCSVSGQYNGNLEYFSGNELHDGIFSLSSGLRLFLRDDSGAKLGYTDVIFTPPDPTTRSQDSLPLTIIVSEGEPPDSGGFEQKYYTGDPDPSSVQSSVRVSAAGQITPL